MHIYAVFLFCQYFYVTFVHSSFQNYYLSDGFAVCIVWLSQSFPQILQLLRPNGRMLLLSNLPRRVQTARGIEKPITQPIKNKRARMNRNLEILSFVVVVFVVVMRTFKSSADFVVTGHEIRIKIKLLLCLNILLDIPWHSSNRKRLRC
jgi:hypothetical protein